MGQNLSSSMGRSFNLQAVGKQIQNLGSQISSVGSQLTKSITLPAVGAATAVAGIAVAGGFKRLVGIDTAQAKLKALGHDGKSVQAIMENALAAVKGTSFGLDEAATIAASAVAAGIKPGKELEGYLTSVGDASAIAGTSLQEMGSMFNKVSTSGRAYTGDLMMLGDRGIPIVQYLGEEMGKTSDEIFKMASKGEISAKMYLKAIEDNIGGAAAIMGAESFSAAWANVWAAVNRVGASFLDAGGKGGGFFSQMKPLLAEFTGLMDELAPAAEAAGVKFGEFFTMAVQGVRDAVSWWQSLDGETQKLILSIAGLAIAAGPVAIVVGKIVTAFGGLIAAAGTIGTFFTTLGPTLTRVGGFLSKLTGPVGLIVAGFIAMWTQSENFRSAIVELGLALWDAGVQIGGALQPVFDALAPVLASLGIEAGNLSEGLGNGLAWVITEVVVPSIELMTGIIITAIEWLIGLGDETTTQGAIAQGVFTFLTDTFNFFRDAIVEAWAVLSPIWDKIGQAFTSIKESWATAWAEFEPTWNLFVNTISAMWDEHGPTLTKIAGLLLALGAGGILAGLYGLVAVLVLVSGALYVLAEAASLAAAFISGDMETIGSKAGEMGRATRAGTTVAGASFSVLERNAAGAVAGIGLQVSGNFGRSMANLGSLALRGVGAAAAQFSTLPGKFAVGVSPIIGEAGRIFNGVRTTVLGVFATAGSWLVSAGRDIIMGLARGITGAIGSAVSAAASAAKAALDAAKSVLKIKSPSRVFRDEVGKQIMAGISVGIKAGSKDTNKMMESVMKGITDKQKASVKKLGEAEKEALYRAGRGLSGKEKTDAQRPIKNRFEARERQLVKSNKRYMKAFEKALKGQNKRTSKLWSGGRYSGTIERFKGMSEGSTRLITSAGYWTGRATLADITRAKEQVGESLEATRDALKDLQEERKKLREQVASRIVGELDLTDGLVSAKDGSVKFSAVAANVSRLAYRARQFAGALSKLGKLGLPPGLIQEVASLGTEKGLVVAKALASGNKSQRNKLAADFSAITRWSNSAGAAVSGPMFNVGIAAQQGLIKGLQADSKKLDQAAKSLASRLTKAVKKQLGIKSPSRIFRDEVGAQVVAGLTIGLEANGSAVRAAQALSKSIVDPFTGREHWVEMKPMASDLPERVAAGEQSGGDTLVQNVNNYGNPYHDAHDLVAHKRRHSRKSGGR